MYIVTYQNYLSGSHWPTRKFRKLARARDYAAALHRAGLHSIKVWREVK